MGNTFSKEHGRGLDFREVRKYNLGDDTRFIDWNVTSRLGELFIREYFEDRDSAILILLDRSASMEGTNLFLSLQIATFLGLFHLKQGNQVIIATFSDNLIYSRSVVKNESDLIHKVHEIEKQDTTHNTNFTKTFESVLRLFPKYKTTYWISDFVNFKGFGEFRILSKQWDQFAIFIEHELDHTVLPKYFFCFERIDRENKIRSSLKSSLQDDIKSVKNVFKNQVITVRSEEDFAHKIQTLHSRLK
ncbi:MAG: DUF58 domain-containing protein [Leptospira sp.]|nr:DUF58 domain-containing protein [Leptospira sp.]